MSTLRRTLLAALVLGALVLAAAAIAPPSQALPAWDTTTYYYNSSWTELVGTKDVLCSGQIIIDGQVTPYRQTVYNNPC